MTTFTLDTLATVRKLKAAGFSEDQAEAVTTVINETREADITELATKTDLNSDMSELKADILKWVLSAIGFQTIVIVGAIVTLPRSVH